MKRTILTYMLGCVLCIAASAAPKMQRTSFGIFTDSKTYSECRAELDAYRDVLLSEGLNAVIQAADWANPDEVKAKILEMAADKKAPLEGIVLVGDVPIAQIREAQHMTTAFKMDEDRYPIFQTSVASDRFYDDFDLQFEFVSKSEEVEGSYYYRLLETGKQHLHPDIYSARMKVPQVMIDKGMDKYELMRKYLRKVVVAHKEVNPFDNFTFFFGHGYYTDDMGSWRQKAIEWREAFPAAYKKASTNRFLNFHQDPHMKWTLFSELQRKGTDFFQFSEHGAPDTQYINGSEELTGATDIIEALKRDLASSYYKYSKRGNKDAVDEILSYVDSLGFDRSILCDSACLAAHVADSLASAEANIDQKDLLDVRSNPRIVILNACYNGSFHDPEGYIAGVHLFGDGDCIVAQGNTVNALQDKWEDKLVGFLALGLRAGFWQKEVCYLENHMLGDPTYRFAPAKGDEKLSARLHDDLVLRNDDLATWKAYLSEKNPTARAAGIIHMGYAVSESGASCEDIAAKAYDLLCNDPSWTVRISSLKTLQNLNSSYTEQAILKGLEDPFELVVRHAALWAGDYAAPGKDGSILKALESLKNDHKDLVRASYDAGVSLNVIKTSGHIKEAEEEAADASLSPKRRLSSVRLFRNNNSISTIPVLMDIVKNPDLDVQFRRNTCEVLGWYNNSAEADNIVSALQALVDGGQLPERVHKEAIKTIKRIKGE